MLFPTPHFNISRQSQNGVQSLYDALDGRSHPTYSLQLGASAPLTLLRQTQCWNDIFIITVVVSPNLACGLEKCPKASKQKKTCTKYYNDDDDDAADVLTID